MNIYVYVTRKPDPLDANGPDISAGEWIELIESDPDLSISGPPNRLPRDQRSYAVWASYPRGYPAWFALSEGSIEVKGIDEAILAKLRSFAAKLDARIVSEMGEEFS
jgi:hypothetical protein